jgi:hypothetical protein
MQLLKSDQICHGIFALLPCYGKSTVTLLQSLCSTTTARSPIELSESVLYSHHYSSISQSVSGLGTDCVSHEAIAKKLQTLFMGSYPASSRYLLQTDTTPVVKAFSPKLADRQYISIPNNVIAGNKNYRQRYDIEGHNRFSKQRLLLDKYQTPDVQTLDNWTLLVAAAYWLLFYAADDVQANPKPWEKYLPKIKELEKQNNENKDLKNKENKPKLSVAQTQKAALNLFNTFDKKPFAPKSVKNGKGRKKGDKQTQH